MPFSESRIFSFFSAVLRDRGRFQTPLQTPVRTRLWLKSFPKNSVGASRHGEVAMQMSFTPVCLLAVKTCPSARVMSKNNGLENCTGDCLRDIWSSQVQAQPKAAASANQARPRSGFEPLLIRFRARFEAIGSKAVRNQIKSGSKSDRGLGWFARMAAISWRTLGAQILKKIQDLSTGLKFSIEIEKNVLFKRN